MLLSHALEKQSQSVSDIHLMDMLTKNCQHMIFDPLTDHITASLNVSLKLKKNKEYYGERYQKYDYELLFSLDDGSPIEPKLCEKRFKKWQAKSGLEIRPLDFHGIRHSCITYKMKLSGGDLSTVKGDSGHSTVQMVGSYADHIFDEECVELTQTMEDKFYTEEQNED